MIDFDEIWIDICCPKCNYPFEVQMIDAKLECLVYCPNCKASIKLTDNNASIHSAETELNNLFDNLNNIFS